ncbi:MAG TPA: hydroxymethylbilane synthase, partial [Rhodocyclaceae bacterium]|nr:hydroxymethylbilane synthase [Rhodocyclaceae bacterium]
VSRALAGSCEVPLAAYAEMQAGNTLRLRGLVALPDGSRIATAELSGNAADPEGLGLRLVEQLRADGADAILAELPGHTRPA